jgi:hypothetical protein
MPVNTTVSSSPSPSRNPQPGWDSLQRSPPYIDDGGESIV